MLKKIENLSTDTAQRLYPFFNKSVTDAYVLFSLLDCDEVDGAWVQTQGDEITALVVKRELSKVYVTATENSDFYEIAEFITGLGGMVVHCPSDITARLGVTGFSKLTLMTLSQDLESDKSVVSLNDNLYKAFNLLIQGRQNILKDGIDGKDLKKYSEKAYKQWHAKISRGIAAGHTTVNAVKAGENSVLCVCIADKLQNLVYLRDIATDSDFRKMGYAADCVAGLCNALKRENDTVFLACDDIVTENFYKKIGFKRESYLELGIVEL